MSRLSPRSRLVGSCAILLTLLVMLGIGGSRQGSRALADTQPGQSPGQLRILDRGGNPAGLCPLKHTDVDAHIDGYVARVRVRQTFTNPSQTKVEAVYIFPLPDESAVDDMKMTIGDREIDGDIKEREEARQIYEQAKAQGHVAALLDQERPNIFTQSVANIEPGATVVIEISYSETLKLEDGTFEWSFPMVVGPRYLGKSAIDDGEEPLTPNPSPVQGNAREEGDHHPVASSMTPLISPPITPRGTRAGHDVSLHVRVDAGMPIQDIQSVLHDVDIERHQPSEAEVSLKDQATIPNKDFILRYRTSTDQIGDAFLTDTDSTGHYFTLVLQPPRRVQPAQIVPKEMVFCIDQTGSQYGWPLAKAKETMRYCIKHLNPGDTFQLLGFNTDVYPCFDKPVEATAENIKKAFAFLEPIEGEGGTDILKSVDYALRIPDDPKRLRIVCYMTDGYVGNDFQIIDYIKHHRGRARMFPFGVGNSVNRMLIDGMASAGGGVPQYVTLNANSSDIAQQFYNRIQAPVLTNISFDWGNLSATEVYPRQAPDLFSVKPIIVTGRLLDLQPGIVTIHGMTADGPFERQVPVTPTDEQNPVLPSLWARAKIDDLMLQDMAGLQDGTFPDDLKQEIIDLGLSYRLMTQFTSFVAVEYERTTAGGQPKRVDVPVEMPDGVSYDGIFGKDDTDDASRSVSHGLAQSLSTNGYYAAPAGGFGGGGFGGGMPANAPAAASTEELPAPPPLPMMKVAVPTSTAGSFAINPQPDYDESGNRTSTAGLTVTITTDGAQAVACSEPGEERVYLTHKAKSTSSGPSATGGISTWTGTVPMSTKPESGWRLLVAVTDKHGFTREATLTVKPSGASKPSTVSLAVDPDLVSATVDKAALKRRGPRAVEGTLRVDGKALTLTYPGNVTITVTVSS